MAAAREPERPALALFAAELRAARGHAALSREDLAVKLNYSASLVAMIETERRTPSRDFAARCDEVFDTPGTFSRLEERLRDLPFPASFRPFAGYEAEARSLRMFEHVLVPGLLQTPEYARAVLSTRPHTTSDELESLVAARLARQVVLDRKDPPLLWVVLDEGVLHRPVISDCSEPSRSPRWVICPVSCTWRRRRMARRLRTPRRFHRSRYASTRCGPRRSRTALPKT